MTCRPTPYSGIFGPTPCSGIFGPSRCSGIFAPLAVEHASEHATRISAQSFAARKILDRLYLAFTARVRIEQRIFQVAHAIVLLILSGGQLGTELFAVGQGDRFTVLPHIRYQHIQVARGRVVFHGRRSARWEAQCE